MTLREIQLLIRDKLNACDALVQGRCRAFAEDALSAQLTPEPALHAGSGGLALVVRTPGAQLSGAAASGLPVSSTLAVDCIEVPGANRAQEPFVSAMGAAERVAHLLHDGRTVTFDRFESSVIDDKETRFYVFTAYFAAHFTHTKPQD
ncbi:MAG: hypothetical protein IJL06_04975 [Kiritimatiellae bacterium]|nr:hypothetical protein [Kiritimatiellia bacterium]